MNIRTMVKKVLAFCGMSMHTEATPHSVGLDYDLVRKKARNDNVSVIVCDIAHKPVEGLLFCELHIGMTRHKLSYAGYLLCTSDDISTLFAALSVSAQDSADLEFFVNHAEHGLITLDEVSSTHLPILPMSSDIN